MPAKKSTAKKTAAKKPAAKKRSTSKKSANKVKRGKKIQLVRGMKDILPQEQGYWEYVYESAAQSSRAYGYSRIDVPVIEDLDLFQRTIGEGTDVIDKEMFEFTTKGNDTVGLRPEFTAGIARAFIEHGMINQPKPVKLWTSGQLFRYDRPQAGRYRQFHQLNWEIIGSDQPALDAEIISLGSNLLRDMGLKTVVLVNSIGTRDTREEYIKALKDYLKPHKKNLDEKSQERLTKNPLRILDSKDEATRAILEDAPQIVDFLDDSSREHFMSVLEYLDEGEVPYRLAPNLVRGLDYYSHTTFEFILEADKDEVSPMSLGGGGRYDYLLEELGSAEPMPAVGAAMGVERIILAIKDSNVEVTPAPAVDVFLAQIGETARKRAFKLFDELRQEGIAVASNISKNKLSDQLSIASKADATITLILGQKEMMDDTIIVRDMEAGSQETIDQSKLMAELKKRLKK